jgi:hypothetical protein
MVFSYLNIAHESADQEVEYREMAKRRLVRAYNAQPMQNASITTRLISNCLHAPIPHGMTSTVAEI